MKHALTLLLLLTTLFLMNCSKESKKEPLSGLPDSVYLSSGSRILSATFDTLQASLLAAIQSGDFDSAISYCQANAHRLTSSYSDSVTVRRATDRPRNPANRMDSLETWAFNTFENTGNSQPLLIAHDKEGIHVFKAIRIQPLCLNCHGQNLQPAVQAKLKGLYPEDVAIGYQEGNLRGVWHVAFRPGRDGDF